MKQTILKRKLTAAALCTCLLFSLSGAVEAAEAEKISETVYVLLDTQGTPRDIIVKHNGEEQSGAQGELPFQIKLSYELDGKAAAPEDMVGKSGSVGIRVAITANGRAKPCYREQLALQMQLPLDTKDGRADQIVAKGLSGVTVGTVRTLGAIVLPGKSASYEISYETTSFTMQSVNFVCMPFDLMGIAEIDLAAVDSQIATLQDGIGQYVAGVAQASDGLAQVNGGMKRLAANGAGLQTGFAQAAEGAAALMQAMLQAMPPEQQQAFAPQLEAMQAGQAKLAEGLGAYVGGVSQSAAGLKKIAAGTAELAQKGAELKNGVDSAVAPLSQMPKQSDSPQKTEAFLSGEQVEDIQFVMKTDGLTDTSEKADLVPQGAPKATFWTRLLALFGV